MTSVTDQAQDNPFRPLLHAPFVSGGLGTKELYSPVVFDILLAMNALSIVSSLLSILLLTFLRKQHHGYLQRWSAQPVSQRVILLASIIDVLYSGFRIYNIILSQFDTHSDSEQHCQAAMFGMTFFALLSVFTRAMVSVHLHMVVVYRVNRTVAYETRFMVCAFFVALALALLPLTRYSYAWISFDPTLGSGHCSYFSLESVPRDYATHSMPKDDAKRAVITGLLWCWATYFGWVALTVAYCFVVVAVVIWRLWNDRQRTSRLIAQHQQIIDAQNERGSSESLQDELESKASDGAEYMMVFARWGAERRELWSLANKVLRRVAQFPATIIACHTLEVGWATTTLMRIIPILHLGVARGTSDLKRLYIAMQVMLAMQGIFTLLALCLEPAVKELLASWWVSWHSGGSESKRRISQASSYAMSTRTGGQGIALPPAAYTPPTLENMPWDIVVYDSAASARQRESSNL